MTVSVVVPTYNGAAKILNILAALKEQTAALTEVLVVIDGSTDNTREILAKAQSGFPLLRIIDQTNQGRAAVRNTGAREATGELLVFFDDDMRPQPQCVAEHLAHHQRHPGTLATGMHSEEIQAMTSDVQLYKAALSRKWLTPFQQGPASNPMSKKNPFLTAANFSISKTDFWKLHGFDSQLRDAEDFDLGVRAIEAGYDLYILPNAFAWHDDFITCASYVKRLREYRRAHQLLVKLRPELYRRFAQHQPQQPAAGKAWLFRLLADKRWVKAIDNASPFVSGLPQPLRYKFYDLVTTALGVYYVDQPYT